MAARHIAELKRRCGEAGIPTLYVNDNFGRWQSDFAKLVTHCRDDRVARRLVMEQLVPDEEEDYFVLKPKHSGFFSTTLDTLLEYLGAKTLILTGLTARHLRALHRQRRVHARLPPDGPVRLRGVS